MGKNKKKRLFVILGILLIVVCALGYWKRRGIYNIVCYQILDLPRPIKEDVHGYYETVVDVETDVDERVSFQTTDDAASEVNGNLTKEVSLPKQTAEIDAQVTAEAESGNYSFEEPLVILNPYQISPLTGVAVFETKEACRIRVTVKGKTEAADISGETAEGTVHRVPIIGLYPDMENTVVLEMLDAEGQIVQKTEVSVKTEGLPDVFAGMVEPVYTSGESAYDLTIVSGQSASYPFAYDVNGDIRWYLSRQTANNGVFALANQRMIFQDKEGYIPTQTKSYSTVFYEMDYLGRTYQMYFAPNGTHHEIIEKEPGGNFLVLTSSLKDHVEEKIMEIDRNTGEVVKELELTEVFGNKFTSTIDWAHLNTVSYKAEDDTILISPRNLHSGVKINYTTGEIVWILGNPKFWEGTKFEEYVLQPTEDFMWHYQQHTVYEVGTDLDGNPDTIEISIFDNHVHNVSKVKFYEKSEYSYATIYAVNEKEKTVSLLKQIPVVQARITSNTIYDADSGHLFAMCGAVKQEGIYSGMTYEFDYETGELLNQFYINKRYYRAIEMNMDYEDLSSPMETPENYITGSLRPAVKTGKSIAKPEKTAEQGVISFRVMSNVLFAEFYNHQVSQIIFKGENASYVYDMSFIKLYDEQYLQHVESVPIPLMDMEAGTYQIYCVYQDEYYDTGTEIEL